MKKIKKNLFGLSLVIAVSLGVFLSFAPQKSEAMFFGKITCWSSANGSGEYVNCATCTIRTGQPTGGQGKCGSLF